MSYDLSAWAVTDDLPRHTEGIHVRVGMVTSLNGHICEDGTSRNIGGDADLAALIALRNEADAVINTATTVVAEQLKAARTRFHVVVTATNKLDVDHPIFADDPARVIIVAGSEALPAQIEAWQQTGAIVHQAATKFVDMRWLIQWLRDEHGIQKVICEGGPSINAQMSDANLVDEWCVTLAAKLLANPADNPGQCHRLTGPLMVSKPLYLRHLLATQVDVVGIYSTHPAASQPPHVSAA